LPGAAQSWCKPAIDELWAAVGKAISIFTPAECANYFNAAGYEPV